MLAQTHMSFYLLLGKHFHKTPMSLEVCLTMEPGVCEYDEQQLFDTDTGVHILGRTFAGKSGNLTIVFLASHSSRRIQCDTVISSKSALDDIQTQFPANRCA